MYPFVETIRIEQGVAQNLECHQQRLAATMAHFFQGAPIPVLAEKLQEQEWPVDKTWKVHLEYDGNGILLMQSEEYHVRSIRSLKLISCDDIDYEYKSADRRQLAALAAMKGEADEVVIVRNGLLTDTSYSNIALFDGQHWVTPRLPLLKGTMRQSLLDKAQITERDIRAEEWEEFQAVSLINAMMPLGRCVCRLR